MSDPSARPGLTRLTLLRGLLGVAGLVSLGWLVFAGWMVVDDLSERGEMFDGLGLGIGLAIGGSALVVGGLAVAAIALARRWPVFARVVGLLLALGGLGLLYPLAVDRSAAWLLLVPLPVSLAAVAVLPDRPGR